MIQTICILGRQPALGLAELESLLGYQIIQPLGNSVLLECATKDVPFDRLGGTIKLAELITSIASSNWSDIRNKIATILPALVQHTQPGKIRFGLSVYNYPIKPATINKTSLELKKIIKNLHRSVRIIPNNAPELNSAQILHNQLIGQTGIELLIVIANKKTYIAKTVLVQDIAAYAARDQMRPKRDARVGMLPPKLAQIIINLANPAPHSTILDPFCGTGVLLQEAALMGFDICGSDIEPRMIAYSQENLQWLMNRFSLKIKPPFIEVADALKVNWTKQFSVVATETYLGRPLTEIPKDDALNQIISDCSHIHTHFLKNIATQLHSGTTLSLALPAWNTNKGFQHLTTLDHLTELGYTRSSFVHVSNDQLIYYRPNQVVARELVILRRI